MPLNLNKFTFYGTQRTAIRKSIFGESVIDMNFNYLYHCIDDATNVRRSSDRRLSVSLFLHNQIYFSIFVDFLNIFEFRKAPQRRSKIHRTFLEHVNDNVIHTLALPQRRNELQREMSLRFFSVQIKAVYLFKHRLFFIQI